mmetsp:Transcript_37821/g.99279  ORF Transcript_37821/g.99279 Transcript_37821/m.99279 type:complete len:201 (+) Transcript_37821:74-676(+)
MVGGPARGCGRRSRRPSRASRRSDRRTRRAPAASPRYSPRTCRTTLSSPCRRRRRPGASGRRRTRPCTCSSSTGGNDSWCGRRTCRRSRSTCCPPSGAGSRCTGPRTRPVRSACPSRRCCSTRTGLSTQTGSESLHLASTRNRPRTGRRWTCRPEATGRYSPSRCRRPSWRSLPPRSSSPRCPESKRRRTVCAAAPGSGA